MRPVRSRRYKDARFLSLTVTAAAAAVGSGCPGPGARYSRTRRSGRYTWAVRPAPRPAMLP
jgi:hypothetical protein